MANPDPALAYHEHKQRHVELHRALDELYADFIRHQPLDRHGFLDLPIIELIHWSHQQTIEPTEPRG